MTTSSVSAGPSTSPPRPSTALAVLPFRYRGPVGPQHLAEALADELVDLLSTMQGLRVSSSGATARLAGEGDRDPRSLGRSLGVDAIVDGSMQVAGERLRVAMRLLDAHDGFQLWSERYEAALEHEFDVQDKLGKRIAESLRVELELHAHREHATSEALDHHQRARTAARTWSFKGPTGAIAAFESCLALAPRFEPALSDLALACVRAYFVPQQGPDEPDWAALAEQAVARAEAGAATRVDTLLARAMLDAHEGRYREAAKGLRRAIDQAPTFAGAHEYLGRLQLEAGQPEQAIRHLELAATVDPLLIFALPEIARYHALRGDLDGYERELERYAHGVSNNVALLLLRVRVASWQRAPERLRPHLDALLSSSAQTFSLVEFAKLLLDSPSPETIAARIERLLPFARNPRFAALLCQLGAEVSGFHAHDALTLRFVEQAAAGVLVDLDWLERCPLLDRVRGQPAFEAARQLVLARAAAIWAV